MLIINFILGLLPIIWLVIALCGLKWPGYKAALGALIIAAVEALTYFGFSMSDTLTSILEGFAFAMWPIVIVIIAAVFTYNLSLRTGSIDMIKKLLTSVSADKRILIRISFWHQLSGVRAQFPADRVFRFSVFFLFSVPVPPET